MSYPYFFDNQASGPDAHDLEYTIYDPRYVQAPGGSLGASPHFDAGGFWYRSDPSDSQHINGTSEYSRGASISAAEHIKHRRTRSGCFTCRSRRVKCDETRPTCDRCKKGNRHCDFPPPASAPSKRPKPADPKQTESRASSTRSQSDREEKEPSPVSTLQTIKDESEDEPFSNEASQTRPAPETSRKNSVQSLSRKLKWRQLSEASTTSAASRDKAMTPSTETSSSKSRSQTPNSSLQTNPPVSASVSRQLRWADRPAAIQKYLQYHEDHISFHHYFLKFDMDDFIHTELIDLALTYEPLLYAVVAFSAYHHTVRQPSGQLANFLSYYSKSLSYLMKSLSKGAKATEATLLTVLQLTTFEEYLGDWVNLVGHHRAAHYMLLELYTPDKIMETEVTRQILAWYARFDVMSGLMAGNETVLDRRWYVACCTFFDDHIDTEDVDVEYRIQYLIAQNRLVGMDMAVLYSRFAKGAIDHADFLTENAALATSLQALKTRIENLNDGYYTVNEFPDQIPLTSDDIVNPYVPGGLFHGPYWALNQVWCDWYGLYQMHEYQTSLAMGSEIPAQLEQISLEQCRIYEALDRFPDAPPGSCLAAHNSLALASVFLKKDTRHINWARRKLAHVERLGYVFPPTFRQKMAQLWNVPEVEHWWLPGEEGYLPILKEIRKLIEERVRRSREGGGGNVAGGDDLRDIKAIFSKMNVSGSAAGSVTGGEESSPGSVGSGTTRHTPPRSSVASANNNLPLTSETPAGGTLPGLWPNQDSSGGSTEKADRRNVIDITTSPTASLQEQQQDHATPIQNPRRMSQPQLRSQPRNQSGLAQAQATDRMSWAGTG